MEALALFVSSYFAPDLHKLGADDFATRERETQRCDNLLSALQLPRAHEDPEVNHRIQWLRGRNLLRPYWWLDAEKLERTVYRRDFAAWVDLYLVAGRSAIAEAPDTFEDIHCDGLKASAIFAVWPVQPGENEGFLRNTIIPGEYDRYLAHLDYHLHRAPVPREK